MANGHGHKIPEKYWMEIYDLYASGVIVPEIHRKLREDYQVDVSLRTVTGLLAELRKEKRKYLNEVINAETDNDLGRLNWLQMELETFALDCRREKDKEYFLKSAAELRKIYELKINLQAVRVIDQFKSVDDNGRAKLLEELQKLS